MLLFSLCRGVNFHYRRDIQSEAITVAVSNYFVMITNKWTPKIAKTKSKFSCVKQPYSFYNCDKTNFNKVSFV